MGMVRLSGTPEMRILPHPHWIFAFSILVLVSVIPSSAAPEAFQIGEGNVDQLPGGKEADGIIGDFILRNDLVEAVISCDAPLRRANMSTFYGDDGITPGCLYDLTLCDEDNDQLVIFCPLKQKGDVSHVRVVSDGATGEAVIETVVNAEESDGLYKRHEYRLVDGWQGIMIVTILRNESEAAKKLTLADVWNKFTAMGQFGDIRWADAIDPADKAGYAYAKLGYGDVPAGAPANLELQPGDEFSYARFVAVGRSPMEAAGVVSAQFAEVGTIEGTLTDTAGRPVTTGNIFIEKGKGKKLPAYPDAAGRFSVSLPAGDWKFTAEDIGRPSITRVLKVTAGESAALEVEMEPASAIAFDVRDEAGKSIPCKAQGSRGRPHRIWGPTTGRTVVSTSITRKKGSS